MTKITEKVLSGIKPAASRKHEIIRLFVAVVVLGFFLWTIQMTKDDEADLCDIAEYVKPDTILYKSISELDHDAKKNYIKSLKQTFDPDPPIGKKYLKSIQVALVAGIASEYVVNGNFDKPVSIIPRTILFTVISTGLNFV